MPGGDAGLLRPVEDGLPLLRVQRAVGPGHLDERDDGERGHDLGPDAELDQPVDDRLVRDPDHLGQGLAGRGPLLHLAEALDGPLAFLAEERVLEALASVTQDLLILGHAHPPRARALDSVSRRRPRPPELIVRRRGRWYQMRAGCSPDAPRPAAARRLSGRRIDSDGEADVDEIEVVKGAPVPALDEVRRRVREYAAGTGVTRAIVFGSFARGDADLRATSMSS